MTEMSDEAKKARTAELDMEADIAAEQAVEPKVDVPEGHLRVLITKHGDNKIHTGGTPRRSLRAGGAAVFEGDKDLAPKWRWKDTPLIPKDSALIYEERGWVEIQV